MNKTIKYLFFAIIICLISVGIYILYEESEKTYSTTAGKSKERVFETELNLGTIQFDTINPIETKNIDIQYIDKLIFQSLLTIEQDFKLENELAEEVAKLDNKTYIIKLKQGIMWHDNSFFNPNDVIYTVNKIKENMNSIYYNNVKNIEEMVIIDKNTIKLKLREDVDFFKYMLIFPIIKEGEYLEKILNGTGQYRIKEISEKQIILEKTKNSQAKINKIIINSYNKNVELYNEFSKGNIDMIYTSNINYEEYLGTIGYKYNISSGREFNYLAINNQNYILKNKEIREAISYAINVKEINYNIYNNKNILSKNPLNPDSYLYKDLYKDSNLIQAKQVLINNGWKYINNVWIKNNQKISISVVAQKENETQVLVAREIKSQLEEIGIAVEVIEVSNNYYNDLIKRKDYELLLASNLILISSDISNYFGEENIFNFNNNNAKEIIKNIKKIEDIKILKQNYEEIIKLYEEEVPFIGLYFNSNIIICSEKLHGNLAHNWFNLYYNIENWYIEEKI